MCEWWGGGEVGVNEQMHAFDLLRQSPLQLLGSKLLLQRVKRNWGRRLQLTPAVLCPLVRPLDRITVLSSGDPSTSHSIATYHPASIGQSIGCIPSRSAASRSGYASLRDRIMSNNSLTKSNAYIWLYILSENGLIMLRVNNLAK
jgi:hypothetical protein